MAYDYMMLPGARLYLENGKPVESLGALTGPAVGLTGRGHVHEYDCGCQPSLDGTCNCPPSLAGVTEAYEEIRPALGIAGAAAGAYHGYKRNQSIGWAIGWSVLGGFFPLITGAVALAQGFGKRKKK